MSLSSYNGQSNFTIKGKKFLKRGANNIYDIASVAGTSGNFSTGWVNTDGTTTVANGATLTFDHNLGTTDLVASVMIANDASGADARILGEFHEDDGTGGFNQGFGYELQGIANTSITLQLGSHGYFVMDSAGRNASAATKSNFVTITGAAKYIKVILSAGGSGGGSGNIVASLKGKITFPGFSGSMKAFATSSDPVNFPFIGKASKSSPSGNFIVFQNKTDSWAILGFDPAFGQNYASSALTEYWKVNANDLSAGYGANSPVSLGQAFGAGQYSGNEMIYNYCLIEPQAAFGMPVYMPNSGSGSGINYYENGANILASLGSYDGNALKAQYDASNLSSVWSELNMNSGNTLYICDTY